MDSEQRKQRPRRIGAWVLLVVGSLACAHCSKSGDSTWDPEGESSPLDSGPEREGEATYYNANGTGNCSFEERDTAVAALNTEEWDTSAMCGACAEVTGESGTTTVRIVDRCPGCKRGDLDLSEEAFEKVAPLSKGRVPIKWRYVTCAVEGNLRYHFKDGSSQWWTAIQIRNHRLPISGVEWRKAGGEWARMNRQTYNYFVTGDGVGTGPFELRITALGGAQVTDTLAGVEDNEEVDGTVQFPAP